MYTNGEYDDEHEILVDDDGTEVTVIVRLIIHRGQKDKLETLAAAVLVHDIRVAGIDFESRYKDAGGQRATGWHLHDWDVSANSSEYR